jgi:hypothetical protein
MGATPGMPFGLILHYDWLTYRLNSTYRHWNGYGKEPSQ